MVAVEELVSLVVEEQIGILEDVLPVAREEDLVEVGVQELIDNGIRCH
ncbi:hypothetical protein KAR91_45490 [Candidatus Pacearchaeota archaeon]|nr:hypothetical protein [Candidatus Pacearchaeota archaeon]